MASVPAVKNQSYLLELETVSTTSFFQDTTWDTDSVPNPECRNHVFVVVEVGILKASYPPPPPVKTRPELDKAITSPYREDFEQAANVLELSPKASAALSRRILQQLIREKAGISNQA